MWESIIMLLAQVGLWILKRIGSSEEKTKDYLQWVKKKSADSTASKLHQWAEAQERWLKEHPISK